MNDALVRLAKELLGADNVTIGMAAYLRKVESLTLAQGGQLVSRQANALAIATALAVYGEGTHRERGRI